MTERIAVGRGIDAFADRWSQLCVEKWERGVRDRLLGDTILSRVRTRQAKITSGQVIPFRQARFGQGDVPLGRDLAVPWRRSGEIWLPEYFFGTPWLILGRTGQGKSVLAAHLSLELAKRGPKTWLLSFCKDDLLGQLTRFQQEGLQLAVLRAGDLKFNPLQAGTNEPRAHLAWVTARLARCLRDLPPRADLLLRGICHQLYREFGVFNGQRERWPNLFRVHHRLQTSAGLNVSARDALQARLGSFLERLTPRCGAWLKGWDPIDLARRSILFLFRRAPEDVGDFVLESMVDHVFQHQVEEGVMNSKLELCLFVDDAQRLIHDNGSSAVSGLDEKVGKIRGGGVSIFFFAQGYHGVSPYLLPNINGFALGRTVEDDVPRILGLNEAQRNWVRLDSRRGQFVGVIAEGDWHEPFAFESKNVDLAHQVTEADILESQRPLASLPLIPDDDFLNWERHPFVELQADAASPELSPGETRFWKAVVADPGKPAGHYTRKLGMNGKTARAARERLVQLGLLRDRKVQLIHRGKPAIVLEPLAAAAHSPTPMETI